jgi:hypothetical protein
MRAPRLRQPTACRRLHEFAERDTNTRDHIFAGARAVLPNEPYLWILGAIGAIE